MLNKKILPILTVILALVFIVLEIYEYEEFASFTRFLLLPLLTLTYYLSKKESTSYFFYFLLFYSVTEVTIYLGCFVKRTILINYLFYYGGNILYVTSYVFLALEIIKSMKVKQVFKRFKIYIIVLLVLDVYSIFLITEIALESDLLNTIYDYLTELIYNTVIMTLLTITLINYISRHNAKAMYLLLGALCIVISEDMQVAYYYVSDTNILNIAYSVLLVFAFYFFYSQTNLNYDDTEIDEITEY